MRKNGVPFFDVIYRWTCIIDTADKLTHNTEHIFKSSDALNLEAYSMVVFKKV